MMDLSGALYACRCGNLIRDDGGTMKPGWKIKFVADDAPANLKKPPHLQEGRFIYVNPKNENAHRIVFHDAHRASWQWRTINPDEV